MFTVSKTAEWFGSEECCYVATGNSMSAYGIDPVSAVDNLKIKLGMDINAKAKVTRCDYKPEQQDRYPSYEQQNRTHPGSV